MPLLDIEQNQLEDVIYISNYGDMSAEALELAVVRFAQAVRDQFEIDGQTYMVKFTRGVISYIYVANTVLMSAFPGSRGNVSYNDLEGYTITAKPFFMELTQDQETLRQCFPVEEQNSLLLEFSRHYAAFMERERLQYVAGLDIRLTPETIYAETRVCDVCEQTYWTKYTSVIRVANSPYLVFSSNSNNTGVHPDRDHAVRICHSCAQNHEFEFSHNADSGRDFCNCQITELELNMLREDFPFFVGNDGGATIDNHPEWLRDFFHRDRTADDISWLQDAYEEIKKFSENGKIDRAHVDRLLKCVRTGKTLNYQSNVLQFIQPSFHFLKTDSKYAYDDPILPYLGLELEVEAIFNDKCQSRNVAIQRAYTALANEAIIVHDGSLERDKGFEIVTIPATLNYHREKLWNKCPEILFPYVKGFANRNYGIHVHISRKAFTPLSLNRFLIFVNHNRNNEFIDAVAQRKNKDYARITDKKYNSSPNDSQEMRAKYQAVNILPEHTIELRIFRSTTKREAIMRYLEFSQSLWDFCKHTGPIDNLSHAAYLTWMTQPSQRKYYPALVNWLIEKNWLSRPKGGPTVLGEMVKDKRMELPVDISEYGQVLQRTKVVLRENKPDKPSWKHIHEYFANDYKKLRRKHRDEYGKQFYKRFLCDEETTVIDPAKFQFYMYMYVRYNRTKSFTSGLSHLFDMGHHSGKHKRYNVAYIKAGNSILRHFSKIHDFDKISSPVKNTLVDEFAKELLENPGVLRMAYRNYRLDRENWYITSFLQRKLFDLLLPERPEWEHEYTRRERKLKSVIDYGSENHFEFWKYSYSGLGTLMVRHQRRTKDGNYKYEAIDKITNQDATAITRNSFLSKGVRKIALSDIPEEQKHEEIRIFMDAYYLTPSIAVPEDKKLKMKKKRLTKKTVTYDEVSSYGYRTTTSTS